MDDLISEFITETSESLAVLDLELVKLEQNPNDREILGNIFRLVHTIKGTCGFLGLPRLESVAHAGENVLGKIRDGEIVVTDHAISIVLEALDCIKGLIEYLAENGREPEGEDNDLKKRLNAFADSNGAVVGTASASASASAPAPATLAAEPRLDGMFSPGELKMVSSTTSDEMDALERAFANASATIEGGMDFTKAPDTYFVTEEPPAAAATPVAKPAISDQAKEKAIKQGLETDAQAPGAVTSQSIRVNLDVLENLMQMVGELVLTRNQLVQIFRGRDEREVTAPLQQLSQITSELQESVMKTRMQPIGNAWSKFPRLIRDLSHDLNKKIELKMIGESTELDRQMIEMIKDPLTHMVRNSCDHGLELPADRMAAGKSEAGTVTLAAYHEGGHIVIEIKDDGRGLNLERIKEKIIEKQLATQADLEQMSDEQIMQYIFKAGFSTAEKVTSVSGRGVGMDVVRTNIEKIGGTVSLSSAVGKGSTFLIKLPLTLAIVSVLLVESARQKFAIPQLNVVELVRVGDDSEYKVEHIHEASVLRLRDKLLPLLSLRNILHLPEVETTIEGDEPAGSYVAVLRIGAAEFGIVLDRIHDTEEIVVKPMSRVLSHLGVYSGNTILGDGSVIMILDPNGLARAYGDMDLGSKNVPQSDTANAGDERRASFLLFTASGEPGPKAVPLELVSRLEEIEASGVEYSANVPVVQYRGEVMRLKTLNGQPVPAEGCFDVVVFTYDGHTIGLVVDAIVDITEAPLAIQISSTREEYLGGIVIDGKTTDVVDVGFVLKELAGDLARDGTSAKQNGLRLLFVEDSPFFMKLTVPFLTQAGYEVFSASHPREALALVAKHAGRFDLVVTDIEMPEMDGFDFAIELRRDPMMRAVPIFAFTSTVNELFKERGAKAGMNGMVLKTDREALLQAIAQHPNAQEAA
ncbi:MAG: chemotaxis protein CheW [Rickettsiales bacterium]